MNNLPLYEDGARITAKLVPAGHGFRIEGEVYCDIANGGGGHWLFPFLQYSTEEEAREAVLTVAKRIEIPERELEHAITWEGPWS